MIVKGTGFGLTESLLLRRWMTVNEFDVVLGRDVDNIVSFNSSAARITTDCLKKIKFYLGPQLVSNSVFQPFQLWKISNLASNYQFKEIKGPKKTQFEAIDCCRHLTSQKILKASLAPFQTSLFVFLDIFCSVPCRCRMCWGRLLRSIRSRKNEPRERACVRAKGRGKDRATKEKPPTPTLSRLSRIFGHISSSKNTLRDSLSRPHCLSLSPLALIHSLSSVHMDFFLPKLLSMSRECVCVYV